jgi:release factor glutamine methyltransferase
MTAATGADETRAGAAGTPAVTVAGVRRELARRLSAHGIETPALDARLLVGRALDLSLTGLAGAADRTLAAAEIARIEDLATRRLRREPVARITGTREFWGLPFAITPDVLVPRPDTETVVEQALAVVDETARAHRLRIADLGTGSGAILIALLRELPHAVGIGTDRHDAALAVARDNARTCGVLSRAAFACCDFAAALASSQCDIVVTNPPYIRTGDIDALEPEVRVFDPPAALDGGADGLSAYRAIATQAARILRPGGTLVAEIGHGQGPAVTALFAAAGLAIMAVVPDLGGVERAVVTRRAP